MFEVDPDEKVYSVFKISKIVDALKDEGVPAQAALEGIRISEAELTSPLTKVSANQVVQSYRNALTCSRNPSFAFDVGSRFHVSTFGIYGLALLSGVDFRQTVAFAVQYYQLTAPLVEVTFEEQPSWAAWGIAVFPFKHLDAALHDFIVELQFGALLCVHRDLMGSDFHLTQVQLTSPKPSGAARHAEQFGCEVLYEQPRNRLLFPAGWLDEKPSLGNPVTYAQVADICDKLLTELKQNTGVAGKVRQVLLANLESPPDADALAGQLGLSPRTLRRRLQQEHTSYRELIDDLRAQTAIRYIRDTRLTVETIAFLLGFSDPAAFRYAFRRWTNTAPNAFRRSVRG
ncbi:AraC family transcriptional regulator [Bradyrhizobium sp. SRS-191]|uniref:AraC family transcriptional regulator n=1 Tax=Bradyrhizobium sp. SRS-191 TaxID=2962606 RepID=UPI00211E3E60|nr:AraC family transcriptional regulator [Bradyrhizobium sp. SRS-191]